MQEKPNYNKTRGNKTNKYHQRKNTTHKPHKPVKHNRSQDTRVYALGGLNEIGKNMYCVEHDNEIIIIDAGVKFAEEGLPGIDYVIPDYSYLKRNEHKIRGLLITHGHEDHIGGIPFLLQVVKIPFIYASPLACAMITRKLEEKRLTNATHLIRIDDEYQIKTKYFNIGFFKTNHSIPESLGIIINSPNGRIVSTGDFKFDLTPVGEPADFQKMSFLGETGVTLLLSDSTNAEVPTFSKSEKQVAYAVQEEFRKTEGRLIVATFASNVHRVQQIVEAAVKFNRKILVFGRSMENNIQVSRQMGYIKAPDSFFISNNEAKKLPDNEILILCTGSQGEALAALSRIANGTHKFVKIKPGDTVVFSSSPIPGNEKNISKIMNELALKGAQIVFEDTHVSGHACREELRLIYALTKPKYAIPVHGEYRHLMRHRELAIEMGIPKENAFVLAEGDVLELNKRQGKITGKVQAGGILVDGLGVGDVGNIVLNDRKLLSQNGLIIATVTLQKHGNMILAGPDIVSRGFVYVRESESLMEGARDVARDAVEECLERNITDWARIKTKIKDELSNYIWKKTKRNPMILPIITEV